MPENATTYTAIQDWMLDLGLDVYGVLAYAVIYGFSQDGESTFTGSLSYLARKMVCGRTKAISTLKKLVEKGLIQKVEINRNGVKFCEYRAFVPRTGGARGERGGGTRGEPNNIDIENIDSKDRYRRFVPPTFEEVSSYCRERQNTVDPQEFIDHYTANGWMVGKNKMKDWRAAVRTWEAKRKTGGSSAPRYQQRTQKESPFQSALRTMDELNGTHDYDRFYGPDGRFNPKKEDFDDQ